LWRDRPRALATINADAGKRRRRAERRRLLLGDDSDRQLHVHVGVQMQVDRVLADRTQRAGRQPDLTAGDRVAGARTRLGDVARADRAEELPLRPRLGGDRQPEFLEVLGTTLAALELLVRDALELGAARLESGDVLCGRERRLALRQQVIASEARANFHAIADVAEVRDLLEQNDFHRERLSAGRCTATARGSVRA